VKRRNLVTGKIEHVRYPWPNKAPIYRMGKRKATEIKGRVDDEGPGQPGPSPPS
jgi:hypothetical protein